MSSQIPTTTRPRSPFPTMGPALLLSVLALHALPAAAQSGSPVRIRIVNAQTSQPVTNERLNVALTVEQLGYHIIPTDKTGTIVLTPGDATTLRVLSNFYADCRPRGEIFTNYPLATVRQTGVTGGNLCSSAHPAPKPGELLLFVIPKNAIRTMGQPPSSNPPHSDEDPHATTDNPYPVPR